MSEDKRGGKRTGAGRPKLPYKRITISIRVRPEVATRAYLEAKKIIDELEKELQ
jgi:hypothetical protein